MCHAFSVFVFVNKDPKYDGRRDALRLIIYFRLFDKRLPQSLTVVDTVFLGCTFLLVDLYFVIFSCHVSIVHTFFKVALSVHS